MAIGSTTPNAPRFPGDATTSVASEIGGLTDSMLGKYYCRLLIGKYKRPSPFNDAIWNTHSAIHLPLPDVLSDDTSVKYSGIDLTTVGDIVNGDALTGVAGAVLRGVGSGVSSLIGNSLGALAGAATGGLGDVIGPAVEQAARNALPAESIQTAFEQSIGLSPNPNPSIAFQGPNLREFQLSWTFFPRNKTESQKVTNIIALLKRASLPSNTIERSGALLNYPDMVQLNFFPWDKDGTGPWGWSADSIIRIKKCVMSGVNVDYNPSNVPGFFANTHSPVAIRLSIGFTETEYMLSSDWGGETGGELLPKIEGWGKAAESIIQSTTT
jgi:hypothetical protein